LSIAAGEGGCKGGRVGAFDVLEPEGGATVALVAHVPHGGTRVPADVRGGLLVDDERVEDELLALTDWHTAQLFAPPTLAAGGVAVVNRTSRLVVDPERLPDAREPMARFGLGAVYTRTLDGAALRNERDAATRVALLDAYFLPWTDAVDRLVMAQVARHGHALIMDGHSFPSKPFPFEDPMRARPDVCLGFEHPHDHPELIEAMTERCRARGLSVARNEPFAGSYVPLPRYGADRRVRSMMVELNRAGHLDEVTGERSGGFAATVALVNELTQLAAHAAEEGW